MCSGGIGSVWVAELLKVEELYDASRGPDCTTKIISRRVFHGGETHGS